MKRDEKLEIAHAICSLVSMLAARYDKDDIADGQLSSYAASRIVVAFRDERDQMVGEALVKHLHEAADRWIADRLEEIAARN